jgi:hypothetical protein
VRILVIEADDDRVAWVEWTLLDEDVDFCFSNHARKALPWRSRLASNSSSWIRICRI